MLPTETVHRNRLFHTLYLSSEFMAMEPTESAELVLYNLDDFQILWQRNLRKTTDLVHFICDGFYLDHTATEPAEPSHPSPIHL
jgi:hypothetical protein